jgi:hypothetical protein
MSDAIDLLKEQHAEVTALLIQIQRAAHAMLREQIFRTIDTNLRIHSAIEEQIFYPAFRERVRNRKQADEVAEAYHEHDVVKSTLEEMERSDPGGQVFARKLLGLQRAVLHHVMEEEKAMLKQARRLFTQAELEALAHRMEMTAMVTSPVYQMGAVAG